MRPGKTRTTRVLRNPKATMLDMAIAQAKELPRRCVRTQDISRAEGLARLSLLITKTNDELERKRAA